jgi:hypothetical protein
MTTHVRHHETISPPMTIASCLSCYHSVPYYQGGDIWTDGQWRGHEGKSHGHRDARTSLCARTMTPSVHLNCRSLSSNGDCTAARTVSSVRPSVPEVVATERSLFRAALLTVFAIELSVKCLMRLFTGTEPSDTLWPTSTRRARPAGSLGKCARLPLHTLAIVHRSACANMALLP